jgi:hypothetical protein
MRRHYKEQSFNAVKGNNRCLGKKHTKQINALSRGKRTILNIPAGGTYSKQFPQKH